jgi:pyruvate/2-oxoglutarate dehydrogenase complex dihydrolipoamide acyltransferase (E2) component
MPRSTVRLAAAATLAALLLAACSKGETADAEADDTTSAQAEESAQEAAPEAAAQPAAAPGGGESGAQTSAPLAVADIDRWQRGMDAELKAVREAGEKLKAAKTGTDTVSAMMGANDMQTRDAGAAAAGVSPERYQFVRTTLSSAAGSLSPLEMEMKVSDMPPAMVEEMKKAREGSLTQLGNALPPDVVEALRPRAAALRKQDLTLTGERLKAMGERGG